MSSLIGYVVLFANLLLPIFCYRIVSKAKDPKVELPKFQALYEDIDLNRRGLKYFVIFVISRRILQSFAIVLFYEFPLAQNLVPWCLHFGMMCFYLAYRPHNRLSLNIIETGSEIGFFCLHSLIMIFAIGFFEDEGDEALREIIGKVMIAIVCTVFFA